MHQTETIHDTDRTTMERGWMRILRRKPDEPFHARADWQGLEVTLCANMSETTLNFFKVEGTESFHDRERRQKS